MLVSCRPLYPETNLPRVAFEPDSELFDGATAFETYAGIYKDKVRGKILKDKKALNKIKKIVNL